MKKLSILISLLILCFSYACQDDLHLGNSLNTSTGCTRKWMNDGGFKIAILSDIHVMAPSLLVKDGPAFQAYLAQDPKLLEFSSKILQVTIDKLISEKPDLVLIAGDLTKDGEIVSHELVSRSLQRLVNHGIKVLVTIGNHDVNNPEAAKYNDTQVIPVQSVPAHKIRSIYPNFGFANSLSKDPNSLSYVSEPLKDLWVIAIDANKYYDNTTKSTVGGVIKPETMSWIKERLAEAQRKGKTVIGMMHHGLVEHFTGQQTIDLGYVIDNWESSANELIDAGMKIILTGHYHANDITKREHNGKFIFDVETGSTLAYPCTYRMLTIEGKRYSFVPETTTDLMGLNFDVYATTFLSSHLDGYFYYVLTSLRNIPDPPAGTIAPWFREAAMAHLAGDEVPPLSLPDHIEYLNGIGAQPLAMSLGSLWTDINTKDNSVTIDMGTGDAY
ncbi:MAG: metallophosphoesterase [Bacteroidota bacterium]|nr:metallophosphoesterase [Bacteroidota bacterium]